MFEIKKENVSLLKGKSKKDKYPTADQEEISELMIDQYYGLQLVSYEDLERLAKHYLERFDRLIL
jgi:hypothetical protein